MKDQIDIFEKESECDYKGEHYSVRDNGAVMRHPKTAIAQGHWTTSGHSVKRMRKKATCSSALP